jgi:hypothetical protein
MRLLGWWAEGPQLAGERLLDWRAAPAGSPARPPSRRVAPGGSGVGVAGDAVERRSSGLQERTWEGDTNAGARSVSAY